MAGFAAKPNQKWLKYYVKIVSISAVIDDSKPPCTHHSLKCLITMLTNVNAYVWTVIFVCLQSVTR